LFILYSIEHALALLLGEKEALKWN
jgi:hypothetical protein